MFNRLEELRRQQADTLAALDRDAEARRAKAAAIVAAMEADIRRRHRGRHINNILLPAAPLKSPPSKTPGGMATWLKSPPSKTPGGMATWR